MTKDEAFKLALEAFHGFIPYLPLNDEAQCGRYDKAITAIKEALAQPAVTESHKQEPVVWAKFSEKGNIIDLLSEPDDDYAPLYTTPPQRKPLTDEQARFEFEAWHKDAYTQSLERYGHTYKNHHTRCRWQGWLAAHGIKEST